MLGAIVIAFYDIAPTIERWPFAIAQDAVDCLVARGMMPTHDDGSLFTSVAVVVILSCVGTDWPFAGDGYSRHPARCGLVLRRRGNDGADRCLCGQFSGLMTVALPPWRYGPMWSSLGTSACISIDRHQPSGLESEINRYNRRRKRSLRDAVPNGSAGNSRVYEPAPGSVHHRPTLRRCMTRQAGKRPRLSPIL